MNENENYIWIICITLYKMIRKIEAHFKKEKKNSFSHILHQLYSTSVIGNVKGNTVRLYLPSILKVSFISLFCMFKIVFTSNNKRMILAYCPYTLCMNQSVINVLGTLLE